MPAKAHSFRIERVSKLIQELLGPQIAEVVSDMESLVTISKVEVTRDLRHANIWLSILGGDDIKILSRLEHNTYNLQGGLNEKLHMKVLPRIHFMLDTSPRYAQHISEIINDINEDPGRQAPVHE